MAEPAPGSSATSHFRQQHECLSRMAAEILDGLDARKCAQDATDLRKQLALFSGRLLAHATMEEQELYPRLRSHADRAARTLADRFWLEFGEIYQAWFAFFEKWRALGAIEEDLEVFVEELRAMMVRLGARMHRENEELYAMVDRLSED